MKWSPRLCMRLRLYILMIFQLHRCVCVFFFLVICERVCERASWTRKELNLRWIAGGPLFGAFSSSIVFFPFSSLSVYLLLCSVCFPLSLFFCFMQNSDKSYLKCSFFFQYTNMYLKKFKSRNENNDRIQFISNFIFCFRRYDSISIQFYTYYKYLQFFTLQYSISTFRFDRNR